jgi:hypothetical protein
MEKAIGERRETREKRKEKREKRKEKREKRKGRAPGIWVLSAACWVLRKSQNLMCSERKTVLKDSRFVFYCISLSTQHVAPSTVFYFLFPLIPLLCLYPLCLPS